MVWDITLHSITWDIIMLGCVAFCPSELLCDALCCNDLKCFAFPCLVLCCFVLCWLALNASHHTSALQCFACLKSALHCIACCHVTLCFIALCCIAFLWLAPHCYFHALYCIDVHCSVFAFLWIIAIFTLCITLMSIPLFLHCILLCFVVSKWLQWASLKCLTLNVPALHCDGLLHLSISVCCIALMWVAPILNCFVLPCMVMELAATSLIEELHLACFCITLWQLALHCCFCALHFIDMHC